MPSSSKEGKEVIRKWISEINAPKKIVLDLGVGKGTYYNFFKKKSDILRQAKWIGIEVWKPYIEKYRLNDLYDNLYQEDIRNFNYSKLGKIDIVFAGDVLEHLTKEESISLIDQLIKLSKFIFISIPIVYYPQEEVEDNPFERHIKDDWSHQEVLASFPNIKKSWEGKVIGVYLIET
jgi:hypothetical protein